ncbi:Gag polyprotein [Carex littledalei]|uniref:Gag polyprotein n=1 Tax=Carex littledalei TaxID=544730 RepID=A0A833QVB3_9POAL|nr:Gag polyprotein [Carex littledalei]
MAAPRFNLITDLELPLRALSEAISTLMASLHELSKHAGKSYWRKPHADTGQHSRAEIVQTKLAELKRASSPSDPLCFKCGDRGHLAAQCYNATLCFLCNCHGHQSSQCRAITSLELSNSGPLLSEIPIGNFSEIPIHTPQLLDTGYESRHHFIPTGSEVSTMPSLKRMETELAELKHEMVLMEKKRSELEMAMAGMNAHIHPSQSNLEVHEVANTAQQSSVIQIEDENIKEVHATAIAQKAIISPKKISDRDINEVGGGFKAVASVKVKMVEIQQTKEGIEAARKKTASVPNDEGDLEGVDQVKMQLMKEIQATKTGLHAHQGVAEEARIYPEWSFFTLQGR